MMTGIENLAGSLHGDEQKKPQSIEDIYRTIEHIENIIDKMRDMHYEEFLAMCRVIVQSNYDIAYSQLKAMARVQEIMNAKEEGEVKDE